MTERLRFKNEYGRDITVAAERTIAAGGTRPGPRVRITIAGPDSQDTNEVTPREAKVMAALITRLLSK
jgi:hypothetical protein